MTYTHPSGTPNGYDQPNPASTCGERHSPLREDINNDHDDDDIYAYYKEILLPALVSSIPLLCRRLLSDVQGLFRHLTWAAWRDFLKEDPLSSLEWYDAHKNLPFSIRDQKNWIHGNFTQFLLRNFDTDGDGHISASELLHVNIEKIPSLIPHHNQPHHNQIQTWIRWFQCAWPLLDWKIGLFLWRTCGSLLLLIAIATIVPGRLHGLFGRILRWPILALTYLMITAELIVYINIRLFIRLLESIFSTRKHRCLRADMDNADSYEEWHRLANELDVSQGRDAWRSTIDDDMASRYNWAFIDELISDMRNARDSGCYADAIAVLQQCTRKNVGGVMSEDMFSYTNTGEPKDIVKYFLKEVETTLKWLTQEVIVAGEEQREREHVNGWKGELVDDCPQSNEDDSVNENDSVNEDDSGIKDDSASETGAVQKHSKEDQVLKKLSLTQAINLAGWALHSIVCDHQLSIQQQPQPQPQPRPRPQSLSRNGRIKIPLLPIEREPHQQQERVTKFLKRAMAAYGRTALCLSGGAMMGCYHFGHVKALLEEDVLPDIISGTSSGSIVAAMICTRTTEEIKRDLKPEILLPKLQVFSRSWPDRIRSVYENGTLFDMEEWLKQVKWFCCGDLTFEEAYQKTGRILNITLSVTTKKAPPVLVNYITAPCVTIASAILASAAVPGFIKPVYLQVKDADGVVRNQMQKKDQAYWDGSIDQDLPMSVLAEMFNCQFFLAAQCNPHIVPFFHNSKGDVGRPSRWSRGMREDSWRGGFLLAALELYLKSDMRAKFHFLNDLEAAVGFTSTMMTQEYGGTTTIVPQISVFDYFKLFSNPTLPFLKRCFQVGSTGAYRHCAMMKSHFEISYAIDECLGALQRPVDDPALSIKSHSEIIEKIKTGRKSKDHSLNASTILAASL